MKTTVVLTDTNHRYLEAHATGERGLSRFLNDIVHAHMVLGPLEKRLQTQADRLDSIIHHTAEKA